MDEKGTERPGCCAECRKYVPDKDRPGHGFCDNWATVDLTDDAVCHPNMGIKTAKPREEAGRETK